MPKDITLPRKRLLMYAIAFAFSLSVAIPTYINSSFLAQVIDAKFVGIIYTAGSILAIAAFIEMPSLMKRFGNFRTTIFLVILEILSLAGLAWGGNGLAIISAFILNFVTISLVNFALDVFLEEFSSNKETGKIRGTYLTIGNIAWLISPALSAFILDGDRYAGIYIASAILLVPVALLIYFGLRKVQDPPHETIPFWKSFGEIWANRNIKGILLLQFLLQFFYAWMVIYTPIYLHETVGFDWQTIGLIFTIMLVPFILLEGPLGRLADKNGEKTMLGVGFVIMAISTTLIAFVTDHNALLWALILFMTRVGAAIVEIMTDTYFFKKVDASKTHIISFFRTARPIAYVIGPVVATLLFTVFDMRGLFIFLGLLMFYGLRYSLAIEDVK